MRFNYIRKPLIVRLIPQGCGNLYMQFLGKVGHIPYSIEGQEQRICAMMLLRSNANHRPTRFAFTRNGEVTLADDTELLHQLRQNAHERSFDLAGKRQTVPRYRSTLKNIEV